MKQDVTSIVSEGVHFLLKEAQQRLYNSIYANIKDYLTKVILNIQQEVRHWADRRSEEWTSVNITPDVSIGPNYCCKLKVENKGHISDRHICFFSSSSKA